MGVEADRQTDLFFRALTRIRAARLTEPGHVLDGQEVSAMLSCLAMVT